jgi:mannose-6-phosphate isomerase-like protein (cupin superfamily)
MKGDHVHVQRKSSSMTKYEYGCDLRRVFPWAGVASPVWGAAIASVRPGEATTPDIHDESETFIVLSGRGRMELAGESEEMESGDVVFIPKSQPHRFHNLSLLEPLVFISIFWDSPEARGRMAELVQSGRHDL